MHAACCAAVLRNFSALKTFKQVSQFRSIGKGEAFRGLLYKYRVLILVVDTFGIALPGGITAAVQFPAATW